ncbi:tyrosine-type recombinase/integrase [Cupriavidus sp. TMH.W2]|uniref:tyrosine-type recombinase/integrase n=1 Tax=Cupriavidus sp. TMH.W2 TaxID=3434465 RepID=UPI003D77B15D
MAEQENDDHVVVPAESRLVADELVDDVTEPNDDCPVVPAEVVRTEIVRTEIVCTEIVPAESRLVVGDPADDLAVMIERFVRACGAVDRPRPLASAQTDIAAVRSWLRRYRDSPKTLRAMRKEAERFLLWVLLEKRSSLAGLSVDAIEDYKDFVANPLPLSRWVSTVKWPRSHPNWRPFAGALSSTSQRYAHTAIGSLFRWLHETRYLNGNPVAHVKKPRSIKNAKLTRFLSRDAIGLAFEAAAMGDSPRKVARDRFMLSLFYLTGLRTFEGTAANMRDIYVGDTGKRWLPVLGKGNKVREVPISEELYRDLQEYRLAFGLPADVRSTEDTPLILASNGRIRRASDSTVLKSISAIMARAAGLAEERGMPGQATRIKEATTHWLRHSCFSHLAKATGDLVLVQGLAGHSTIKTTSIYLHSDEDQMHSDVSSALTKPTR